MNLLGRILLRSVALLWLAVAPAQAQSPVVASITEWPLPSQTQTTGGLAEARQGAVWFGGLANSLAFPFTGYTIVRLVPHTGTFTFWPLTFPGDPVLEVVVAPDGKVFFFTPLTGSVYRLDPAVNVLTRWPILDNLPGGINLPEITSIALDTSSSQNPLVWIAGDAILAATGQRINRVTRLNPQTGEARLFTWSDGGWYVRRVTVDASGTPWFSALRNGVDEGIVSLDPNSGEVTTYHLGVPGTLDDPIKVDPQRGIFSASCTAPGYPSHLIRLDPSLARVTFYLLPQDGACPSLDLALKVYFPEFDANKIGRLDPSVTPGISYFVLAPIQTATSSVSNIVPLVSLPNPFGVTATPTTTLVTSSAGGGIEEFPVPTPLGNPGYLAVTPCNTYFTESEKIGRLKTSAEEPVQNLQSIVNNFVSGSVLNPGQGNSLNSKLNAALSAFDRQNSLAASNVLGAFIYETTALVRGSVLSSQQGDLLINPAIAVINGCALVD